MDSQILIPLALSNVAYYLYLLLVKSYKESEMKTIFIYIFNKSIKIIGGYIIYFHRIEYRM